MLPKMTADELLAKAQKPAEEAMKLHPFYRGKMQTMAKCAIRDINDFAIWYTPGVAAPCKAIQADKGKVYDYTNKWNTVAIVSDGTRVLGLGDIGPEASLPVMEGKALIFKYLGGVDAVAICLNTKDPDQIIQAVKWLQPSFGGINLEDISSPKCFRILDTLRREMAIPVWHDDQQGTATVTLAGLTNALKIVGKPKEAVNITFIGIGAANVAISRLLFTAGYLPQHSIFVDSKGILHTGRSDLKQQAGKSYKWGLCQRTNPGKRTGGIAEALSGADVCISLSKSGPDTIKPEWVRTMAKDAILFVCANPIPEIWPWEAKQAGARIVATGRSDFPNQLNNSVVFPALFRGALDVRARTITDEMCIAAASELARYAEERGINENYICPTMAESDAFIREAVAVGMKAIEQGVAREKPSYEQLARQVTKMIKGAKASIDLMMKSELISPVPQEPT
ncbi:MAG: NADP-dependent malic enzyme [Dehalococcoidales bacterium]|nr:NADP-dependent malic enzyme [Dehalococcoidales bacterium]